MADNNGVTSYSEAIKNTSRRRVGKALAAGLVKRMGRSVLYLPTVDRKRLAVFAHHGCLTCVTLLRACGVQVWKHSEPTIHIGVDGNNSRCKMPDVKMHREPYTVNRYGLATALQATIRGIQCVESHLERVVILDSVLQKRLVAFEDLQREIKRIGDTRLTAGLRDADGKARSGMETLARLELQKLGLDVRPGEVIPGVGEVDLLVGEKLIIELDGYEWHSDKTAFAKDRARSRAATMLGMDTLRFTFADVTEPGFLASEVQRYFATRDRGNVHERTYLVHE
ncbi:MAG: hypothetical protein SOS98_00470 [Varibaculum sp.]|nr:hypothetical protein [Varibaculum sp.]